MHPSRTVFRTLPCVVALGAAAFASAGTGSGVDVWAGAAALISSKYVGASHNGGVQAGVGFRLGGSGLLGAASHPLLEVSWSECGGKGSKVQTAALRWVERIPLGHGPAAPYLGLGLGVCRNAVDVDVTSTAVVPGGSGMPGTVVTSTRSWTGNRIQPDAKVMIGLDLGKVFCQLAYEASGKGPDFGGQKAITDTLGLSLGLHF
jgi:hypothetical protein